MWKTSDPVQRACRHGKAVAMTIVDSVTIQRLTGLDSYLGSQILGQEEVIAQVTSLLQRAFLGIRLPNRPIASLLLLGPTRVGKTDTAELLTQRLFGTREKLIRLDMSEYMTVDSIDILRGPI